MSTQVSELNIGNEKFVIIRGDGFDHCYKAEPGETREACIARFIQERTERAEREQRAVAVLKLGLEIVTMGQTFTVSYNDVAKGNNVHPDTKERLPVGTYTAKP
jgi:hypothetical protein